MALTAFLPKFSFMRVAVARRAGTEFHIDILHHRIVRPRFFVALNAFHFCMRAGQWKFRSLMRKNRRRFPLYRVMAVRAPGRKLSAMLILMARLAIPGQTEERFLLPLRGKRLNILR